MPYLGLDVGEKRIGVATGNEIIAIAHPLLTIGVDSDVLSAILAIIDKENISTIVIGLPRNMSGAETQQSKYSREFADRLSKVVSIPIHFQDESLTSAIAKERLEQSGRPYEKGDIDKEAAAIILQDFLEQNL